VIFLSVLLSGTYLPPVLISFLIELPTLIIFSVMAFLVSKYALVYHSAVEMTFQNRRVKFGLISFVVSINMLFLLTLLVIGLSTQNAQTSFTCVTSQQPLSTSSIIVIFYVTSILLCAVILCIGFSFYGYWIITKLRFSPEVAQYESNKQKTKNLVILSVSSTLCLILQCIFLIAEVINIWPWSLISITIFFVVIDVHAISLFIHYSLKSTTKKTIIHTKRKSTTCA